MVLPEELCDRLSALAEQESRTVSNMAKVLIQEGLKQLEQKPAIEETESSTALTSTEGFRSALEAQETKRLKGAPRRFRLHRP